MYTRTHDEIIGLDQSYIMDTYGRYPLVPASGKGATITDVNGKVYTDFTAGIGVNSLGIADDGWVAAVTAQLGRIQHISNYFYCETAGEVAATLVERSGIQGAKVFFGNSGAEANEGAIKVARKYSFDKYGEGRSVIVTLCNSFHGRTITTLTATGQDVFHHFFGPFTEGFRYAPLNDIEALKEAVKDGTVCGILAEPIQGEGGVNMMTADYAKALRAVCDEKDILLMFDEVQCGIGRTGTLFAFEQTGIVPDVVTMAKGLGGGLPIGAFLCAEKCAAVLGHSQHGTTFGSNPVVNAGAAEVLRRMDDAFLAEVVRKGALIIDTVRSWDLPAVKDVRGRGLMIGIQVEGDPHIPAKKCFDDGLLVLTAGSDVVRLLPPLVITDAEINRGLDILKQALK